MNSPQKLIVLTIISLSSLIITQLVEVQFLGDQLFSLADFEFLFDLLGSKKKISVTGGLKFTYSRTSARALNLPNTGGVQVLFRFAL